MSDLTGCPYCSGSYTTAGFVHALDCSTLEVRLINRLAIPISDWDRVVNERDDARKWVWKMYQRWQGTLEHLIEDNERWQVERAELHRQLEVAKAAFRDIRDNCSWTWPVNVANQALAKMDGGSYKDSRGILPWKEGDETAEESIRKLRGGGE